ncbi:MAG: alanine dehydrogenase, partial [Deltaproteobacteria bacterium]|nr:alanine dehydrogenase [Deltaproteobacteria bacterium]
ELCRQAELLLKIKEPLKQEYNLFRPEQVLFTFFHFASNRELTETMLNTGVTSIAYETVETDRGALPLLKPMSEIAGKMGPIVAANCLAKPAGGKGVLMSAINNIEPARFLILGGGNAGRAAATNALGMGTAVTLLENNAEHVLELKRLFPKAACRLSTPETIAAEVIKADAVIGTVHIPGKRAPMLITREMIRSMEPGSVVVDIAIDQGGCFETSRPTSHSQPTYTDEDVIHYCVTNMPGVFPRTATAALTEATLAYVQLLADNGIQALSNKALLRGLNTYNGKLTNRGVAQAHGLTFTPPEEALRSGG